MPARRLCLGIDPGTHGAIALYDPASGWIEVRDTPHFTLRVGGRNRRRVDIAGLFACLADLGDDTVETVFLEDVGPRPGDGHAGAFNFGFAAGAIRAAVMAAGYPLELVAPQTWKRAYKLTAADKDRAREIASRLAPGPAAAGMFRRVCDLDRAEAALIAIWGARQMNGGAHDG